jgi:serine/threonine protein kinase/tetratricopeptide (TPR) repeat protein
MGPLFVFFVLISLLLTAGAVGAEVLARRAQAEEAESRLADAHKLLDEGQLEEASLALEALRQGRKTETRDVGLLLLGEVYQDLGLPKRALEVLQEHQRDYPESQRALVVADRIEGLGGEEASPWKQFLKTKERESASPTERWERLRESAKKVQAGEYKEATELLEDLVRHPSQAAPARAEGLLLLAVAHDALGQGGIASRLYGRFLREYEDQRETNQTLELMLDTAQDRALGLHRDRNATANPEGVSQIVAILLSVVEASEREQEAPVAGPEPTSTEAEPQTKQADAAQTPVRRVAPEQIAADLGRLDVGARVGPYVLAEKLGEGGFGEVYRGLLPVAIKVARSSEDVERLRHFADMQARVKSDRIVRPLALDLAAETPYVVMELVEGATLREVLALGQLEPGAALVLSLEIARALADTHAAGLAHLDLKPENVLVSQEGEVKLTDFDLARSAESAEGLNLSLAFTQAAPTGGTLAYMSPEQRAGKAADARSDVYTFGVCLFEALTGTIPQPGDRPSQYVEGLPPAVDDLFERCFARQERRYANAGELLGDLERALADYEGPKVSLKDLGARLPRVEAPPAAEPAAEEPLAEEPLAEEPAAEEPPAEEPPAEEPPAEEPPAEEPPAEEPLAEEPLAEEPAAEEPPAPRPSLDDLIAARAARARNETEEIAPETAAEEAKSGEVSEDEPNPEAVAE